MTLFAPDVLNIAWEHPRRPHNSKNGARFVRAEDGLDYVAKSATDAEPLAPQAEYVAHWLALRCALPAAMGQWLRWPHTGKLAFGYRFETGVKQYTMMPPEESEQAMAQAMPGLWRLCVLDVFVGNPDRHIDNLLLRRSELDGRWTFIAIDWGKALWNSGFPMAPVEHVAMAGNTAATVAFLRTIWRPDSRMTLDVVARLQALRAESMSAHLEEQMPAQARCQQTAELARWWSTQGRMDRLRRTLEVLS